MKYKILLIAGILLSLFTSCTTNGADIGELYGRWKLRSFTCPTEEYRPDTLFLGFQGEVFSYWPNWTYNWGTYVRTDSTLLLHRMQYGGDFSAMRLPLETALFTIDALHGNELILSRHDSVWIFKKYK